MKSRLPLILIAFAIAFGLLCGGVLNDRVTDLALSNPLALLSYRYPSLVGQDSLLAAIGMAGVPLAAALAAIALLLCAWVHAGPWRATPVVAGATLFFLWCAVSVLGGGSLFAGVTILTALAAALLNGCVVSILSDRPESRRAILYTIIGSGSMIAAIGIGEYIESARRHDYSWRVFSTFTDPNFLAGFLVMTIPLSVAVFLTARSRASAMASVAGLAIQAACLPLTWSRFGLLSMVAALILFGVLVARMGLRGDAKRRGKLLLAICAVGAVLLAWPVLRRFSKAGSESYSGQFRLYTWKAAGALASAKPILGSGAGTFDVASPPYSQVSYTQHAHNSFLQVAAETGYPGALLLLILLAAILARITPMLSSREEPADEEQPSPEAATPKRRRDRKLAQQAAAKSNSTESASDLRIVAAALVAAIAGAVMRNLFDSDLYVPANAIALACIAGLGLGMTGMRRDPQAEAYAIANGIGETPLPLSIAVRRAILAVLAIVVVARSVGVIVGRSAFLTADMMAATGHYSEAIDSYRTAAALDFANPDCPLRSAPMLDVMGRQELADHYYQAAAGLTISAIPQYRYGKFLLKQNRTQDAIAAFEASRTRNPSSLPTLLALAETYGKAGRQADAESVYRKIVALHQSPFGQIRATPEIVEWRFAAGYAALAEIEAGKGSLEEADRLLASGNSIFAEYWTRRSASVFSSEYRPEMVKDVGSRYMVAIDRRAGILGRLRRTDEAAAQDRLMKEVKAQYLALDSASQTP